jgi:cell pole-organizing protein PopZ
MDEATADLLRPLLRQWLDENMHRMMERALYAEIKGKPQR